LDLAIQLIAGDPEYVADGADGVEQGALVEVVSSERVRGCSDASSKYSKSLNS
jgi:hypothetical protein